MYSSHLARRATGVKRVSIRVPGVPHPIDIRIGGSDWQVLTGIFFARDYADPTVTHERALRSWYDAQIAAGYRMVVIDCGANIGLSAIWYAVTFPEALIYAIEPEPENFALLQHNAAPYPNITPIQAAVMGRPARVALRNVSDEPWAWQTEEVEDGGMQAVTMPQLLGRDAGALPFIVKIDVEGAEVSIFSGDDGWAASVPLIVCETHDEIIPWGATAHAVFASLTRLGVRDFVQRGENTFCYSHALLHPAAPLQVASSAAAAL
jgi:FkbM family methyltransferase